MTEQNALIRATEQELENARTKGQIVGWAQGAGAMLALGVALRLAGFLPLVVIGGAVAYVAYKLWSGRGKDGAR